MNISSLPQNTTLQSSHLSCKRDRDLSLSWLLSFFHELPLSCLLSFFPLNKSKMIILYKVQTLKIEEWEQKTCVKSNQQVKSTYYLHLYQPWQQTPQTTANNVPSKLQIYYLTAKQRKYHLAEVDDNHLLLFLINLIYQSI